jgi:hypothetical protein
LHVLVNLSNRSLWIRISQRNIRGSLLFFRTILLSLSLLKSRRDILLWVTQRLLHVVIQRVEFANGLFRSILSLLLLLINLSLIVSVKDLFVLEGLLFLIELDMDGPWLLVQSIVSFSCQRNLFLFIIQLKLVWGCLIIKYFFFLFSNCVNNIGNSILLHVIIWL